MDERWSIVFEPQGKNPGPEPREEDGDEGRNEGAMVVSLATKNGRMEEIARVGFSRENTRNPEASYHEQLDDVVARARKSIAVLNDLTADQGSLL